MSDVTRRLARLETAAPPRREQADEIRARLAARLDEVHERLRLGSDLPASDPAEVREALQRLLRGSP